MTLNQSNSPQIHLSRLPLMDMLQAERIHMQAKRVLQHTGIEVRQPELQTRLKAAGLRLAGDRVFFEPAVVDEYVDEMRRRIESGQRGPKAPDDGRLLLRVSSYPLNIHDLDTDSVVPATTQNLIEMTKLIDSLAEDGVEGAPPGIPTDVLPDLQPLAQYRIAALTARQGATPVDPTSAKTVGFLLDMAEVMDRPIHGLPVYMPTPLRLAGESLDVVLACVAQNRLSSVWVGSMPCTGTSAPIQPFGGLVLSAAELIGGMIAMRILTDLPVFFSANIFPADMRHGAMVFGSPENMLFQMLGQDFNRFYGWEGGQGPGNIHNMAKLPDGQSASEKAAIMTLGAFLGERQFDCAGTLSLDEIFSPEQLLLDCEIRNWVQRAVQGVHMGEEDVPDWLVEIQQGIQRGFMGLDSTLDHYKEQTWYPQRFTRAAIGDWNTRGRPTLSQTLRNEVRRRIGSHQFALEAGKAKAIEDIYAAAEKAVS
jgi:trimethylamine--corrinoid protein Co-methyltransferase